MVQRVIAETGHGRARACSGLTAVSVRATCAEACLVALLLLPWSRAAAQDGRGEARQACAADYQRLCPGINPGGGRIKKCLNDNIEALSDACKQAVSVRTGK